jgi:hypothetical protein
LVDIEFTHLNLLLPCRLILASGTPVKFWRTDIEPDGLRQGRNHKRKQARELVNPCPDKQYGISNLFQMAINIFGGI